MEKAPHRSPHNYPFKNHQTTHRGDNSTIAMTGKFAKRDAIAMTPAPQRAGIRRHVDHRHTVNLRLQGAHVLIQRMLVRNCHTIRSKGELCTDFSGPVHLRHVRGPSKRTLKRQFTKCSLHLPFTTPQQSHPTQLLGYKQIFNSHE